DRVPVHAADLAAGRLRAPDGDAVCERAEHRRVRADAIAVESLASPLVAVLIKRAVVIANPASRRGKRLAERARRALASRSVECDVIFTKAPGHAAELALEHAPRYDAVFALGGDGTAMEI